MSVGDFLGAGFYQLSGRRQLYKAETDPARRQRDKSLAMLLIRALWSPYKWSGAMQLEQVMSKTNKSPFGCHFGEASETESTLLFDMGEDEFDDRPAGSVESTPGCRGKLGSHALYKRVVGTDAGIAASPAHIARRCRAIPFAPHNGITRRLRRE